MIDKNLIRQQPEKYIKWMCFDCLISIDNQVFNLSFEPKKEVLSGGSYGYYIDGKFHTKKWIKENCAKVFGKIYND